MCVSYVQIVKNCNITYRAHMLSFFLTHIVTKNVCRLVARAKCPRHCPDRAQHHNSQRQYLLFLPFKKRIKFQI